MNFVRSNHGCLLLGVVVWVATCGPALGEPFPQVVPKQMGVLSGNRGALAEMADSPEPPGPPLPDEGPRVEGEPQAGETGQGILDLAWQEARAAYKKGAWPEAKRRFEKIVNEYPASPLVPSALSCLAELALVEDPGVRNRADAIRLYKMLVQSHPQSSNAKRAEWRIADLYLEQGWFQEAQAYYEKAMAHSLHVPFDSNRALLGLGYAFMAMRKWNEAEHAFVNVRKRSEHDLFLRYATIGLAHALYRQRRLTDAQAFYDLSYRRWPGAFRLDSLAIYRYGVTQVELHHETSARELMLLLYNLYPKHEYAPAALLHVAEGMAMTSNPSLAEFFYALVPSLYSKSLQSTMARMRLAALHAEDVTSVEDIRVDRTVTALMHNAPMPYQRHDTYLTMLQDIAAQQADNTLGSEALFHLGEYYEKGEDIGRALHSYNDCALRLGRDRDEWPMKASERLSAILKPWILSALKSHDDLAVVSLFHRHGPNAEQRYAQSPLLLLEIAEAHRRLGFSLEAGRLYQQLVRAKEPALLEPTLVGLGKIYLDQHDPLAARKVLERYRFQFQAGRLESEALHLLVAAMRRQGDLQGAHHLCRQWLLHHQKHGDRPYVYLQLAEILGQLDKFEDSAIAYEEAFKAGASRSVNAIMAYAGTLSRLNRHEQAITTYQAALEQKPTASQAEWIHLQTARHWNELKQYDRATVALAEVGETEDPLINRYTTSLKEGMRASRRPGIEEGL